MTDRKTNQAGLDLIKRFEGLHLKAAMVDRKLKIGYGTTVGVRAGSQITLDQAESYLLQDVAQIEAAINGMVKAPLTDNQFSALVSFAYDQGVLVLERSRLMESLNRGRYREAADGFLEYNNVGGIARPQLTTRRRAERALFMTT